MKNRTFKKLLGIVVLSFLIMLPAICLAATRAGVIDDSERNIGGIRYGVSLAYVEQVYGKPTKVTTEPYRNGYYYKVYDYGNGLFGAIAITNGNGKDYVEGVYCKESNLTTPSGFKVGMPFSTVTAKYPAPRPSRNTKDSSLYDYSYYVMHGIGDMTFTVDRKGIIRRIAFFTGE